MKLNFERIKDITIGAVRVEEQNGLVNLYRFTKEQQELYKNRSQDFYMKTFASAGIRLLFKTNSKNLALTVVTEKGSSRTYFSVDLFCDGKAIGYIDNYSDTELPPVYTTAALEFGEFSKEFELPNGEKTVCIYLPWSAKTAIKEISLDDGAFIQPIKPQKKLLAFGDSITQGYDALRSSNRYMARLTDKLGFEEINKAIGGEVFCADLAKCKEPFTPDYVLVSYGSNDWNRKTLDEFNANCKAFYESVSKNYPDSKIFAITPIWRKDMHEERPFGEFKNVDLCIREAVKDLKNVTVITGFDFVPKDVSYFADLRLHPNDEGFEYYFNALYDKIKSEI